jgi:hypothetical protein
MERQKLIELVEKIRLVEGTEDEIDLMVEEYLRNVPDPHALNYLHSKEYEDWTSEQVVDKALTYKPFYL